MLKSFQMVRKMYFKMENPFSTEFKPECLQSEEEISLNPKELILGILDIVDDLITLGFHHNKVLEFEGFECYVLLIENKSWQTVTVRKNAMLTSLLDLPFLRTRFCKVAKQALARSDNDVYIADGTTTVLRRI